MVKSCLFQNGQAVFQELADAAIPALDGAYLFGDGVYEVIAAVAGEFFDLEPHLERLQNSLNTIMMPAPMPRPEMIKLLNNLLEKDKSGMVYLQVSRGVAAKRDFAIDAQSKPGFFAFFQEQELFAAQRDGETSIIFPDIRWALRHVKSTQLMSSRLAKKFAIDNSAYEPIYITPEGIITEGGSSNVFMVKDGRIYTHPADSDILWGITRHRVMELAGGVIEKKFTLAELLEADEVFRTATTQGVRAVTNIKISSLPAAVFSGIGAEKIWQPQEIREHKIAGGAIGKVTQDLAAKYIQLAHSQHKNSYNETIPAAKTA